ncbi:MULTISPECIES: two-partner secretion domain-containing protein [Thiorhodovibrio]|uniref:two-partner secretion domain-containing protein n=1 Tax=Thiorhodovibrio TaxID=61593 RepID=UPI001912F5FA|nr:MULTISPECIES: filamentous hemagglutinin N-terminal domain-containing protein [Thiorhodovibrio]MBK5968610.1 hypothetical protein [Thiorhodovibrio winogradskyi]WPL11292.1 hypothetical protein Thiosp_01025 [Thiorhodovibrio litoralis]
MPRLLLVSLCLNPPALIASICLLAVTTTVSADIATDGSLGPMVELSGPNMQIGAELGKTHGNNLFHSFQQFNIQADQSATFTGPDNIQNVIGRVTGGQVSEIDGALRSEVGQADVFLINPSGVVMGPNATVDVPASLHVSTADELRFQDGSRFSASEPGASTLTMAAPEAFGFLNRGPTGNLSINGATLSLRPQATLSLSGNDIEIGTQGGKPSEINIEGGRIQIDAVGKQDTELSLETKNSNTSVSGKLNVNQARIETSSDDGGSIYLNAGNASLNSALIIAEHQGTADANGGIFMAINGLLRLDESLVFADNAGSAIGTRLQIHAKNLQLDNAFLTSDFIGSTAPDSVNAIAAAGGVEILTTEGLTLTNGSAIQSTTFGYAESGPVFIEVGALLDIRNGAFIASDTSASGDAQPLQIRADSIYLNGQDAPGQFTGLASIANPGSSGQAGGIVASVTDTIEILGGASIFSGTFGSGNAGDVRLEADVVAMNGFGLEDRVTGIASQANAGTGDAGNVFIRVGRLIEMVGDSEISSSTFAAGNAGGIAIIGPDANIDLLRGALISSNTFGAGDGGSVQIDASAMCIDRAGSEDRTEVVSQAEAGSLGAAGTIQLQVARSLEVLNGGKISTATFSEGDAGQIAIRTGSMRLDNGGISGFSTGIGSTAELGSAGRAGTLDLRVAGALEVLNGAVISNSTYSIGNAGDIRIHAGNLILDDGALSGQSTGIGSVANVGSSGNAGDLAIQIDGQLVIANGAQISTNTFDSGKAGNIDISATSADIDGRMLTDQSTGINSQADFGSTGDGGNISVWISESLNLRNNAQISASTFGDGDAGETRIRSREIEVHEAVIGNIAAPEASGLTGSLFIDSDSIHLSGNARLTIASLQSALYGDPKPTGGQELHLKTSHLMMNDSLIDAQSTNNLPAATITLSANTAQLTNNSRVTTESQLADAGPIQIAGGYLWLKDSQITTSAEGLLGDGGDIDLAPKQLILDGGFIQANTAAADASGGDIRIGAQALIASYDQIEIGGNERQVFIPGSGQNVIQAAAPMGVQGAITLATPELDITATLVPLRTPFGNPDTILSNLCQVADIRNASTLVALGSGGVPAGAGDPAGVAIDKERLNRLLGTGD